MNKITEKEFESLYNSNCTKQNYDKIISKIDDRFYEIVTTLVPSVKKKGWVDYGNCNYESEDSNGYFDPKEYKEEIYVGGEYCFLPEPYGCDNSFPTRWLWEDFEKEFKSSVERFNREETDEKELKKLKREKRKELKLKFRKIIESKLTKEELKYVKFKS